MTITDEAELNRHRGPGPCGWCRIQCTAREVHHVFAKGIGGGSQLDVAFNLLPLCSVWGASCHRRYHDGNLDTAEVKASERMKQLVAQREGTTVGAIEEAVWLLLRTDKNAEPDLGGVSPEARRLVESCEASWRGRGTTTRKRSKRRAG